MRDLIDRQEAIEALHDEIVRRRISEDANDCGALDEFDTEAILRRLPSEEPEIIRCKDCRYYEWMSNRVPEEQTWFCHNWNAETGKDDYCSYAERREE